MASDMQHMNVVYVVAAVYQLHHRARRHWKLSWSAYSSWALQLLDPGAGQPQHCCHMVAEHQV